jgi:hypothetical protein
MHRTSQAASRRDTDSQQLIDRLQILQVSAVICNPLKSSNGSYYHKTRTRGEDNARQRLVCGYFVIGPEEGPPKLGDGCGLLGMGWRLLPISYRRIHNVGTYERPALSSGDGV